MRSILIINGDKSQTIIDDIHVLGKLKGDDIRNLVNNVYVSYDKQILNEIVEGFKIKDVKDYVVYLSKYALIIDKVSDYGFNFTDSIKYLDENESSSIEKFEIYLLFFYEIAILILKYYIYYLH